MLCAPPFPFPAYSLPFRLGDKIFVDGGLVDNLPTDVVRKMGADVVYRGFTCNFPPASAKDIQGAFSVLGRSVALVIAESEIRGMAGRRPDCERRCCGIFPPPTIKRSNNSSQRGYDAAQEKSPNPESLLSRRRRLGRICPAEKNPACAGALGVPRICASGGSRSRRQKRISSICSKAFVGKPLDTKALESRPHAPHRPSGRYDSITYSVINDGTQSGLSIRVHEKNLCPSLFSCPPSRINGSETSGRPTSPWVLASPRWTSGAIAPSGGPTCNLAPPTASRASFTAPSGRLGKWFFRALCQCIPNQFQGVQKFRPRAPSIASTTSSRASTLGYSTSRFNEIRVGYGVGYQDYALRPRARQTFPSTSGRVGAFSTRATLSITPTKPSSPTARASF